MIKKEAKEIMDNFIFAMKDIEVEDDFVLFRSECFREEGEGFLGDEDFIYRFLENSAKHNNHSILANKGSWVE